MIDLNHSRNLAISRHAGYLHVPVLLTVVKAALGLSLTGQVTAQTFTVLHTFTGTSTNSSGVYTNSDGVAPNGLIVSVNTLYGTAGYGGSGANGTVFALNTDGTQFKTLYSFTAGGKNFFNLITNSDGANPFGVLVLSGNTLYGTAYDGGTSLDDGSGNGTVFMINTSGTGFVTLHRFAGGSDGVGPNGLVVSGNTLYGTTYDTIFKLNNDSNSTVYGFELFSATNMPPTNSDGIEPSGLLLSGNTLFGTAHRGGSSGWGTVFKVNSDGRDFTTLHSFAPGVFEYDGFDYIVTNSDGAFPGGLFLSGNILYGTAVRGGGSDEGTVFAVNTNGTGFTVLHDFTRTDPSGINSDGAAPAALILSGNVLYGTTEGGGSGGRGTVFSVNADGTGFKTLYNFTAGGVSSDYFTNSDGANPIGLVVSGNTLYGSTQAGGNSGNGTLFSISFAPQLTIFSSARNFVLSWPTSYAGFDYTGYALQSTTNLISAVWTTNLPAPVVVSGLNTVTNPFTGTQQFFRLSQ